MTTVNLDWDENRVVFEVSGHTGYAECGKDIICAAVSTLAFTMRRAFLNTVGSCMADNYEERAGNGAMWLTMDVFRNKSTVKAALSAIYEGFVILEQNYPKFVKTADLSADK